MSSFDALVNSMDDVHKNTFGVVAVINGEDVKGIFDEETDEFEGVSNIYRTLDVLMSDLPSTPIINDDTTVLMVGDGRTFTVHEHPRVGNTVTLVLR